MSRKRTLFTVWVIIVLVILTVAGCSPRTQQKPLRKPIPKTPATRTTTPPTTVTPSTERVMADRFAKVATSVSGVKSATCVVQRNTTLNTYTVMVGLTLNPGIKGTATDTIKKNVANRIRANDKKVTKVMVTTDPSLVRRIKDIASGVIKGKPVSSFTTEINELSRRIAPTMR